MTPKGLNIDYRPRIKVYSTLRAACVTDGSFWPTNTSEGSDTLASDNTTLSFCCQHGLGVWVAYHFNVR
eukprot:4982938-Pyramimonas_sp.AAC.1